MREVEEQPFCCDPTAPNEIRLCINCINARVKNDKYYCRYGMFYKNSYLDIMIFTPEDFGCCNYEVDE